MEQNPRTFGVTDRNVDVVRALIDSKCNYNLPFYATRAMVADVATDMDHFPYKRFFRGVYDSPRPVVIEREAGYRALNDSCYVKQVVPVRIRHEFCWEYPCSTVYPCRKDANDKSVNISP